MKRENIDVPSSRRRKPERRPPDGSFGPEQILKDLKERRAFYVLWSKLDKRSRSTTRRHINNLNTAIRRLQRRRKTPTLFKENDRLTDREPVMAKIVRGIFRGRNLIYHGSRHVDKVLRSKRLKLPKAGEPAIFLTRSPEVAAYWACMLGSAEENRKPGVLILDRDSLRCRYRIQPARYDALWGRDEREERVYRSIDLGPHLVTAVTDKDVSAVIGRARVRHYPKSFESWSLTRKDKFHKKLVLAGDLLVKEGRSHVRSRIIAQRKRTTTRTRVNEPLD